MKKILFFILLSISFSVNAKIKLPSIFGDHMVLQQQTQAKLWGWAMPDTQVEVTTSWDKASYSVRSDKSGNWTIKLPTPIAGGPYNISITDGVKLMLKDVLIGEVWLCSGQSNMAMTMSGRHNQPVKGANKMIALSSNEKIRLFTVGQNTSHTPLDNLKGTWLKCKPENVVSFSATAYFFGKMLEEALNVPVGLICSSVGGSKIEPWIGQSGLTGFSWIDLSKEPKTSNVKHVPTLLYNAMINPIVGYRMRGVVWYQGEANRKEAKNYGKLLVGLVRNWREQWAIGDFAFYYCQIAPYDFLETNTNSAFLREAQLDAQDNISNSGMASLLDIGEKDCIHPANKEITGERLAYWALAKTYRIKGIGYSGPVLKKMNVEGRMVNLSFDNAENGLTSYGKELKNFRIAGEDRRFHPAKATITTDGISLYSSGVDKPVAVRYAFDDFVVGELFNIEGLPASSFRTDAWEN